LLLGSSSTLASVVSAACSASCALAIASSTLSGSGAAPLWPRPPPLLLLLLGAPPCGSPGWGPGGGVALA
jgi:hypothetical protein